MSRTFRKPRGFLSSFTEADFISKSWVLKQWKSYKRYKAKMQADWNTGNNTATAEFRRLHNKRFRAQCKDAWNKNRELPIRKKNMPWFWW